MQHSSPAHNQMNDANTLTVETECRGNLIATLQPIVKVEETLQIAGHVVPEDGSTGKVFFNFGFTDKNTYECELLPKKGLLAHRKLTNKDEDIIAEITDNLKETIHDAKQEELNSMLDDGKAKTPAKTTSRRKSTETEAKSAEKPAEKPVKKKRKTANLTPVGKLGQQISGLKLQIYALKAKKVKAKALENTETYDADAKVYVKQLKDYGKTKEGKAISAEINEVLDNVDEIANLRDAEWRDRSIIVSKINPKTKKTEGHETSILSILADYLQATAKHLNSNFLDVETIEEEIKEKTKLYHDLCRKRTDMDLEDFVEGENFNLEDLEGVQLWEELAS